MAETGRETGTIRIRKSVLIAIVAALAALAALSCLIVPRYKASLATYRNLHKEYRTAAHDLKIAKEDNKDLTGQLDKLKTLDEEIAGVRDNVFTLAAKLEADIRAGNTDKRICYITIDDGPYNRGKEYLKLFEEYDIKATFFLTTANGNKLPDQGDLTAVSMYPEYLRRGHTIGNHTYSHNYNSGGIYSSPEAFMKSVEKQQDFTAEATGGYRPNIIRFPGGSSMAGSDLEKIQSELTKAGYGWVDWTVDSGDSFGSDSVTAKSIKKTIIDASKDQKIMVALFHEWSQKSLDAMPDIIESLEAKGYIFLPLFYDSVMVNK